MLWVWGQPGDARHDDTHAEDAAHAVVVYDASEGHIVVHVLLAHPAVCGCGVLVGFVVDADGAVVPLWGEGLVPFLEVGIDGFGELEDGEGLVLVGDVVGGFGEDVGAGADVGEVDAD